MISAPCLNCEDRHQTCHSSCNKYLEFKKQKEIEREHLNKIRQTETDWYEYKQYKYKKIKNSRNDKR